MAKDPYEAQTLSEARQEHLERMLPEEHQLWRNVSVPEQYQGINAHRLDREEDERTFAAEFAKRADSILRYILDESMSNQGDHYVTHDERRIACTVIQWLGSHVGQGFLADCGFEKVKRPNVSTRRG